MKKKKIKTYKIFYFLILMTASIVLSSCFGFEDNGPAKPTENPLIVSYEQQTVTTKVKNLTDIVPQNPETDKVTVNNVVTETEALWSIIENEWISIFHELSPSNHEKLKIKVNENTTGKERRYILGLDAKGKESSLTIIQEANDK